MSIVIDASVTMAWYFRDESTPAVRRLLDRTGNEGAFAPAHWKLEVANSFATAIRHGRVSTDFRDEALMDLTWLPISIDAETDAYVWTTIIGIADRQRITVYDAAYLELAARRGLALATLDKALRRAAVEAGIELA